MGEARIDGSPVEVATAIAEAARRLGASRLPVFSGLGTDVAGAQAAIALAQRIGGVVDHHASAALLRDLAVTREAGMMVTTQNEARLRADTVLLVGPCLLHRADVAEALVAPPAAPEIGPGAKRRVFWLCPEGAKLPASGADIEVIGRKLTDLPMLLAALRARVAGRPVGPLPFAARTLDAVAADLARARFGVAIWDAFDLDALALEMLCGLVDDLNERTRFAGLSVPPLENALGVMQACGWMTGLPVRTGFARGFAEHDPWRFDAQRLIASGEADCAVWISSYVGALPEWAWQVPMIVLMIRNALLRQVPGVHIQVACPGFDHDAIVHCDVTGTLAPISAKRPSDAISVAHVLTRISAALPEARAAC
jgi:formylmethanofuran dehydrogenase subunit B